MSNLLANPTAPLQPGITTNSTQSSGASSISDPHPDYSARQPDWVLMFDTNEGQRHIKSKTTQYLPATSGMRALGLSAKDEGGQLYAAYLIRALFPDIVKETIRALVGILNREAANIELPEALEDMRELATSKGESLNDLLVQIHMNQLLYGRLGLLVDVDETRDLPLLVQYPAPQVVNWDDLTETMTDQQLDEGQRSQAMRKLLLTVLDESRYERDTGNKYSWDLVSRFRALTLGDTDTPVYTSQVEREGALQAAIQPSIRGKTMDEIPFTFINTTDLATKPGEVPLNSLADLSLAIYRGEADHRSALFMAGQDTLLITGTDLSSEDEGNPSADSKPIIGSGAYLNLPDPDAEGKFIGPDSKALPEQRISLENDYTRAGEEGVKLMSTGAGAEAAETLRIRIAGRTASLQTIATTSAAGLENALRQAAIWVGANPDEVKVEPNLDFITEDQDPDDLMKFSQAKQKGFPLSWQSVHKWLRQKDYTELTFDEELEQMAEEDDIEQLAGGGEEGLGVAEGDLDDPAMQAARDAAIAAQGGQPGRGDQADDEA